MARAAPSARPVEGQTGVGDHLIHFTRCKQLMHPEEKFPANGSIQSTDLRSMVVKLDRRLVRLYGIRFHGKAAWSTPYHLLRLCKPGTILADVARVKQLMSRFPDC